MEDTFYLPGSTFRMPEEGDPLFQRFAGRQARVDEVADLRSGRVVFFTVAGVRVGCPLPYLRHMLHTSACIAKP